MRLALVLAALCLGARAAAAVPAPEESARIAAIVDPIFEADLATSGIPGAAFVYVRGGRIIYARGYGFADLASRTPADADRTIWPIASITKTLTAVAAMQLVERGRLGLDRDVNRSLRRLRVPAQGYGRLTLRHLLSHTAALDELPGRRVDGASPPDLPAFLAGRLRRYRAPGLRTAYGTYAIALAGIMVQDNWRAGYADYLRVHIFRPAGMATARIMAVRADARGVATPYAVEDNRATPIEHEYYVTTPTSSAAASAADMGRFMIALLRGNLLTAGSRRAMFADQATIHPALPGWGLGFQLDRVNGERIAEHGGDIAGFAALLTLLPERGEGFFIVHHGEGGDLRFRVRQALLDALHPAPPPRVAAPDPADAPRLAEYAGRYRSSMTCRTCPGPQEDPFEVSVNPDGSLQLWGQTWRPHGRDLFIREDGRLLLGFSRDRAGRIDAVSGGAWRVADRLP
jgi:CubicO group peptidase (beta-lactamase class C family)